MKIGDHLKMPSSTMIGSMQFVPMATGASSIDGYLVCRSPPVGRQRDGFGGFALRE